MAQVLESPFTMHSRQVDIPQRISRYPDFLRIDANETFWVEGGSGSRLWFEPELRLSDLDCAARPYSIESDGSRIGNNHSNAYDEELVKEALGAVQHMAEQGRAAPTHVFFRLLQECIDENDLPAGQEVYRLIMISGLESDAFLGSHLIRMFSSFGSLPEANEVFRKLSKPDVFSWSTIILAHAKVEKNEQAIDLYLEMHESGLQPDGHIFVAVLKACSKMANLHQGKRVHRHIIESGIEPDSFVCVALMEMYVKCGKLEDACMVFEKMPERNVVAWSALIMGCTQLGQGAEALKYFEQMQQEGIKPSLVTFVCVLKACSSIAGLEQGRQIHFHIMRRGVELDVIVGSTLIDMYAKCGSLKDARLVFDRLHERNVVTWSTLIAGYAQHGHGHEAFKIYEQMQMQGIRPNLVTFVSLLKACSTTGAINHGREIHSHIIESEFSLNVYVGSALIDMYTNFGNLDDAEAVFDRLPRHNDVTWSALISGFTQQGHGQEAFRCFEQMQQDGIVPNVVTLVCILKACSSATDLAQGRQVHANLIESGIELDTLVGNALIDMYVKCDSLGDARTVFDRIYKRDVVTWSTLIAGYAQDQHGQEALQYFEEMQQECIEPNLVTFASALKACSSIAALEYGRQIHATIIGKGFGLDVFVASSLIDMYAKCGSLEDAHMVFHSLQKQDAVVWTAMISGYAQQCNYSMAHRYYRDMQLAGLKPDNVTFLCILSACSRAGLVDEGYVHLKSMSENYGITPRIEHYNSMADLLGNLGHFNEAKDLLETIPFQSNTVGWTSLLSSCKTHINADLGRQCFDHVVTMEKGSAAAYVLMSHIYALAGMEEDRKRIDELRRCVNHWKKPGKAYIEVDNQIHGFTVGDKHHPRRADISAKLKALSMQMRLEGYRPHFDFIEDSVSDEKKEDVLCGHCEKLAIAFGLLCTSKGTTIRISKNLRMCADCHIGAKLISKIEMREIIVVDAYCVHHFQHGTCSCKVCS